MLLTVYALWWQLLFDMASTDYIKTFHLFHVSGIIAKMFENNLKCYMKNKERVRYCMGKHEVMNCVVCQKLVNLI